ncbi:uncharacterized protein LOC121861562 isoform X3 [Homarus americanus]|uniref:Uncharacterized protein n=1 Tax=Homarus americanus TaxID=6706 RepID=A0A8J5N3X2_HOMAM|nr:uncharacterized protein LOC121861562 isoform X3 [Homarus americanus]XP_042215379.1 uncharacterized protein LOC121861562 isoform X3 [Homarus americanus]KAG7172821.1 hypothetical protein Hamer_G007069 [Homarus americanus]
MGFDGFAESSTVLASFKKITQNWEKHCSTLHSLADQIMGMERCEKDNINVQKETFLAVQITIQSKIMEELHNLSEDIEDMKVQHLTMTSLLNKVIARCQQRLDQNNKNAPEFLQLQTVNSINNHMAILIAMKKIPLQNANSDDFQSLQSFKQINFSTKPIEYELEKISNFCDR